MGVGVAAGEEGPRTKGDDSVELSFCEDGTMGGVSDGWDSESDFSRAGTSPAVGFARDLLAGLISSFTSLPSLPSLADLIAEPHNQSILLD